MDDEKDIISLLPDSILRRILSLLPTKDTVSTSLLSKRWQNRWRSTTDLINLLPDNLLHRILSLLTTKDAVSTCLLSKRWQNLWMSTTNLDFYCPNFEENKDERNNEFVLFLSRVLHYHSSSITRFRLINKNMALDPTPWIFAAVQRHVQEVHLKLLPPPILFLPHCLCTSKNLTVLKVRTNSYLHLPSAIRLSSLKILSLECVKFLDDVSFVRLFAGLPVVEELNLHWIEWFGIRNATISLATLKSLTLIFSDWNWRCDDFELKVDAENLRRLHCVSDRSTDLVLDNTPLLSDASLKIRRNDSCYATKLFRSLRFARLLKLDQGSLECVDDCSSSEKTNIFTEFVNLNALEINSVDSMEPGDVGFRVLTNILINSPILESLVIKKLNGEVLSKKFSRKAIKSLASKNVL